MLGSFGISLGNTYIYNWSFQPYSQDFNLFLHTPLLCALNFIHEWRHLQFKVGTFRVEAFHGNFIWRSEFLPEIWWKEVDEEIFFHISFNFRCLMWLLNRVFTSNNPIHNLLDHIYSFISNIQSFIYKMEQISEIKYSSSWLRGKLSENVTW